MIQCYKSDSIFDCKYIEIMRQTQPHQPHNYNNPHAYQFDMRVNVDFATGHVQLGLPHQAGVPRTQQLPQQMRAGPFHSPVLVRSSPHLPPPMEAPTTIPLPEKHNLSGFSDVHSAILRPNSDNR